MARNYPVRHNKSTSPIVLTDASLVDAGGGEHTVSDASKAPLAGATFTGDVQAPRIGVGTAPSAATKLLVGTGAGSFGGSYAVAHFVDNSLNATVNYQNLNAAGYTAFDMFNSAGTKVGTFAWSNASAGMLPGVLWFMTRTASDLVMGTNTTERMRITAAGAVQVATSLAIGAGTALTKAVVYTPTLAPANVSASDEYNEQYFTVTGLSTSDTVIVNPPAMSATPHSQMICARVSAANTLAITFRAVSGTHAPPQGVYRVLAIRS